ncbi:exocyst complex component EXO70H1-like [Cornus florida]|uniref:exocyst complex component EXO70H1-like n=1 Tax=Cornus florida TaxID=4283 RepID=UPI00289A2FAB|nr:exocyst complex component EXO70H1-like [Cornus florida]
METPDNVVASYESAVKIILQWDVSTARGQKMFDGEDHNGINQYLRAVDEIHRSMELTTVFDDDKSKSKTNSVLEKAMARLEEEFVNILTGTGNIHPSYSTSSSSVTDSINYELVEEDYLDYDIVPSEEEINDLRSIAERMDSVQCVQVYRRVRKGIVDVCFQRLGIEKLSIQQIWRLEWQVLEVKIRQWIHAAKFCVQIFFPKEKQLCEQILASLETVAIDYCFTEIVRDATVQLFDFVDAISTSRLSPERLFKFIDLHEALSDLLPEVDTLFQSKSAEPIEIEVVESPIQIRAVEILSQLKEAVKGTLLQLEKEVCHKQSTILVPSGIIHSLTRYVMDYTIWVSEYKHSLTSIIVSKPSTYLKYFDDETIIHMDYIEVEGQTPLALHLIWIIQNLVRQLNVESNHHDDVDLAFSFMVDNALYILQKIIGCPELRMMVGNHLLHKLYRFLIHYVRVSTLRIESSMRRKKLGTSGCCSSGMSRIGLRETWLLSVFSFGFMPTRRDPGESSSSNLVERDQEQVEEDILLRDLFVPPPAPPPPPPKKNELDDTLYHIAKFVKLMPTLFEGGPDPLVADSFMDRVEKHINAMNLATDKLKITLATYNFVGDAEIWWKTVSHTHNLDTMTYATFKKLYYEKYFPTPKRREGV